jgi:two-component system response regulator YesN
MVKVLIVDDELSALERISSFELWNKGNYRIADTARNGKEALVKLQSVDVDVILTDIEMPVMNGIDMIRKLRNGGVDLPVIILSCHESFEYARQAVSLGVGEYILKDFMEENAVRFALNKHASASEARTTQAKVVREDAERAAEAKALFSAVNRADVNIADGLSRFAESTNALVFIHIDGFTITKHDPERFLNEINHDLALLEAEGTHGIAVYVDGGNFLVLIKNKPVLFAERFFDRMRNRKDTITIAVGEYFKGLEHLKIKAVAVEDLFSYRVFLGKNRIIIPETVKSISGKNPSYIRGKIDLIKKSIYESDSTVCFSTLRELYDRDLPGMLKYNYLEYVNLRLLSLILSLSERGRINLRELTGSDYLSIREL